MVLVGNGMLVPPPPFPHRFDSDHSDMANRHRDGHEVIETVAWPRDEGERGGDEQVERAGPPKFKLVKNDQEQYIEALERKLDRLGAGNGGPTSNPDSGYGSTSHVTMHRVTSESMDENRLDGVVEDDFTYGSSEDEAKREGRPLLGSESEDVDGEEEDEGRREYHTPHESPSKQVMVIPATPGEDEAGDESASGNTSNRRISFSNSVRIGGGIRTSSRPHRHRRPPPSLADVFGPGSGHLNKPSQRSTSLVSNTSSGPSSRSGSPSRPPGGLLREMSAASVATLLHQQPTGGTAYSLYSSSPGSQVPSRSSSPCSSIYAPLQASKAHCPTPMSVQPPRRPRNATLTFRDYLNSRDGNESDEEVVRGYHELVAEQRLKRERWEQRQRRHQTSPRHPRSNLSALGNSDETSSLLGFWNRIAELLTLSAAGASGSSRGTITVNYGAMTTTTKDPGTNRVIQHARPKRNRSRLSISPDPDLDDSEADENDEDDGDHVAPQQKTGRGQARARRHRDQVKTEVDVRFGVAPGRWITRHWWVYKFKRLFRSLFGCFWVRQQDHEHRDALEAAYEAL